MSIEDNVVKMPDLLERRAQKIDAALMRQDDAHARSEEAAQDWRDATLELAIELAGAKTDLHNNTKKFGEWCDKRFGNNRLDKNDRAALVRWGGNPEETKKMLANETSQSVQMIDSRLPSTRKSPVNISVGGDKTHAVHAALQAKEAAGISLTHKEIAEALGVSVSTVGEAARDLKAAAYAVEHLTYTKAQEYHIEARIRIELKAAMEQLHRSFEAEVRKKNKEDIDRLFPDLEKIQEDARRNEKLYRGLIEKQAIFTESEYRDILLCTHEANPSKATRERAFMALNGKKLQLTGKQ